MITFRVSRREIERRVKAFVALTVSWVVAQVVFVWVFLTSVLGAGLLYTGLVTIALVMILAVTAYFFYSRHIKTEIKVTDRKLTKVTTAKSYSVYFADVAEIRTVITSRGTVREISLKTDDGGYLRVDGLDDFDALYKLVSERCGNVRKIVHKEPLDYDHVLFYPVLGVILAGFSAVLVGVIANGIAANILIGLVLVYCVAVGAGVGIMKPLTRQYGDKSTVFDYIIAGVLVAVSLVLGRMFYF